MFELTREEAYYHRILLSCGFDSEYDEWLESLLEEEPLSDLALDLVYCGSDNKRVIGCLENYCRDAVLDAEKVCDLLRGFLRDRYYSDKISIGELAKTMRLFANSYEFGDHVLDLHSGMHSMYFMWDYYDLTDIGIIKPEEYEKAILAFINDGTHVNYEALWNKGEVRTKTGILGFFKRIFK